MSVLPAGCTMAYAGNIPIIYKLLKPNALTDAHYKGVNTKYPHFVLSRVTPVTVLPLNHAVSPWSEHCMMRKCENKGMSS